MTVLPDSVTRPERSDGATPMEDAEGSSDLPARLGPYVVTGSIGAGGMGVVLSAYDPRLERKVAVKLLRSSTSESAQLRLLREARALAKMSHPNVVQVFDVGMHEGQAYIAMDHVRGETLRQWMQTSRSPAEIAAVFGQAARGLAAAHEVGIIHRDFKPDNVLISQTRAGEAPRVRVLDFGIASTGGEALVTELDAEDAEDGQFSEDRLTRTGAIIGTPAYMSPEQFHGKPAEAASDQFSCCVALYEAAYGVRPFQGDSKIELAMSVMNGTRAPVPTKRKVPRWLAAICNRGLQIDPGQRFESARVLVQALERGASRGPRMFAALAVGGGVIGVAGMIGVQAVAQEEDPCAATVEVADEIWNDDTRALVRTAFDGYEPAFAKQALPRVQAELDAWVEGFRAQRLDACEATAVRHTQSGALLDRRMACLDARAQDFRATVEVLGESDLAVAERANRIVDALPDLAPCRNVQALREGVSPPEPGQVQAVAEARASIARGRVLGEAGRTDAAVEVLQTAESEALATGYEPVVVEARLPLGRWLREADRFDAAEQTLQSAYLSALRLRDFKSAARAQIIVAYLEGVKRADADAGRTAVEVAAALGSDEMPWKQRASLARVRGDVALTAARYGEAKAAYTQALEIRRERGQGDGEASGWLLQSLSMVHLREGEYEQAAQRCGEAVRTLQAVLGPKHPSLGPAFNSLALTHERLAQYPQAIAALEQGLEIIESSRSAAHFTKGVLAQNLGGMWLQQREFELARPWLERALTSFEQALEPDNPAFAGPLGMMSDVQLAQGDIASAKAGFERSLRIREQAMGSRNGNLVPSLLGLAKVANAEGDAQAALDHAERALHDLDTEALDPEDRGGLLHQEAVALAALGRSQEAVVAIAEARDAFTDAGVTAAIEREELDRWVRTAQLDGSGPRGTETP